MATTKFHWDMGMRIAQRRKMAGLTQEQLAERIDVSTQTISYIETRHNAIRPENLAKLCEALDVSADFILFGRPSPAETNRIAQKLEGLDAKETEAVEAILDKCLLLAGKPVT